MSVEGKDEAGLDGLRGLAVGRQEVMDLGTRHVDPVLGVHVLGIVLVGTGIELISHWFISIARPWHNCDK